MKKGIIPRLLIQWKVKIKHNKEGEENQEICFECVNLEIFIRYISGIP